MNSRDVLKRAVMDTAEKWAQEVSGLPCIAFEVTRFDEGKKDIKFKVQVDILETESETIWVTEVGGAADDMVGIVPAFILNAKTGQFLWASSAQSREIIGVGDKFTLI